jgi:Protein of unknown function (DUF2934)
MAKVQKRKTELEIREKTAPAAPATTEGNGGNPVARRAYQLWLERGCPDGSPEEDWYRAERELGMEAKPIGQANRATAEPEARAEAARSAI